MRTLLLILFFGNLCFASNEKMVWHHNTLEAIRLSGSWSEMGAQAAQLSPVPYSESMAGFLNGFFDRKLAEQIRFAPLRWLLRGFLNFEVISPMGHTLFKEDEDMIRASAQESKIDFTKLSNAYVLPDVLNVIIADALKFRRSTPAIQGCSSFAAFNSATETGERIIGRNLDYPGVGISDAHETVYLIEPDVGYKIMAVAPSGFPVVGISGFNEKGLVVILHNAYTTDVSSTGGHPILSVNRRVLQHAATIEEAIAIYKSSKLLTGWMVHISDRDPVSGEPRSAIVELSSAGVNYFFAGEKNYSALTNNYRTPEFVKDEIMLSPSAVIHNFDRLNRLNQLVEEAPLTESRAMDILSDSYSPYSKSEVDASTSSIRVPDQVNSMVFLPDRGAVLVAEGLAPSSSGAFYEFSFSQMEQSTTPRKVRDEIPVSDSYKEFVKAYVEDHQNINPQAAFEHLKKAADGSADCSYDLLAGMFAARLNNSEEARKYLNSATNCNILSDHHKAIAFLFRGFEFSLAGDSSKAIADLDIAAELDSRFKETAKVTINKLMHGRSVSSRWIMNHAKMDTEVMEAVSWK